MKKSINKVAIVIWALVPVVCGLEAFHAWVGWVNSHETGQLIDPMNLRLLWSGVAAEAIVAIQEGALLLGLGTLIEIFDRIRWNAEKK